MTIGKKISLGYMLVLFFTLIVSSTGLYILNVTRDSYTSFIDVNQRLVLDANQLQICILKSVEGYRGFLLYGEESYIKPWTEGTTGFKSKMDEMQKLVSIPQEQQSLEEIAVLQRKWAELQEKNIELQRQGQLQKQIKAMEELTRPIRQDVFEKLNKFMQRQNQILDQARAELSWKINFTSTSMIIISLFAFISGLIIAFLLIRGITRQLRESIVQLSSSSAEIVATTVQVASGATETATAVSQTTATVEEVKQTAHIATQKAKYVSESAQKAAQVSQKGKTTVAETVGGMDRIKEQMGSIAESIVKLSEQNQAIGEIIATVSDLAEQSNLLAVNASIEAAKAGEQGKGFAVVAQEVRNLAEQSKQATSQVKTILNDIQKAMNKAVMATEQGTKVVELGVKLSLDAGETIQLLSESIAESSQAATQIAASSQQQFAGMDQVALAMENIKQATTQNMAGTKQAEQAAHNLNELGQRLKLLIEST